MISRTTSALLSEVPYTKYDCAFSCKINFIRKTGVDGSCVCYILWIISFVKSEFFTEGSS